MKTINDKENKIKKHLSLEDMVGRYKAKTPINCVDLKQKTK